DRIGAVPGADVAEMGRDELEGVVPRDLLEPSGGVPAHGPPQPVGVVVDVRDGHPLRADVAPGEDVVVVAAHGEDAVVLDLEPEPAGRLAERAGVKDGVRHDALSAPIGGAVSKPRSRRVELARCGAYEGAAARAGKDTRSTRERMDDGSSGPRPVRRYRRGALG